MKLAEANDVWRRLFRSTERSIRSLKISFEEVQELGSGAVEVKTPLTLICGENGAGKTAALALIHRALKSEGAPPSQFGPKALSGTISHVAAVVAPAGDAVVGAEALRGALGHNDDAYVVSIDSAAATSWISELVRDDANFGDLLEGLTPLQVAADDLSDIRALVGKNYASVKIYEIDDIDKVPTFPHFVVEHGGATYSTAAMGKGEVSLLYLYWAVRRLSPKSIALIEEPDAFVAVRSHRYLIDWLAKQCSDGDHLFILSSHSGTIAERFPNAAIRLCTRTPQGVQFVENPSVIDLIDRLALVLHRRVVAIVEDELAGAFLKALLNEVESKIGAATEVVIANGNGGIASVLATLAPKTESKIQFVGVWDADQTKIDGGVWGAIKLPGTKAPELELLDFLHGEVAGIASALNVSPSQLAAALSAAEGQELHLSLKTICSSLDLNENQLCRRLMPSWVLSHSVQCAKFGKELRQALVE